MNNQHINIEVCISAFIDNRKSLVNEVNNEKKEVEDKPNKKPNNPLKPVLGKTSSSPSRKKNDSTNHHATNFEIKPTVCIIFC